MDYLFVEKIILSLDSISKKLHIGEIIDDKDKKETFESLRKRYTVKSEHIVHEYIANENQNGNMDLFNGYSGLPLTETNEEDDNLELF